MESESPVVRSSAEKPIRLWVRAGSRFKLFSRLLSDGNLTKKAYLNGVAATLDYGARLVTGFLVNPLLVNGLGDYLYGVWQVLGRVISYMSAASGRPTEALKWVIANRQASVDYEEKRRFVGNAIVVWLIFLPILAIAGGVFVWYSPVLLKSPPEWAWVVRLAASVLLIDLIITSLVDIPESVLRGENLSYKRMGLTTLLVVAQGGLIALALYLGTGIIGVATAVLIDTLLTAALFLYIVRSYVPWFGIARPARVEVRRFFGLSWWFLVWRLVMQLMMSSDVIVLGLLHRVEDVTTYTLTKYVPETMISLVAIVMMGITPGLGGVIGAGKLQKALHVRSEFMAGTWLIATVVGATTLLWNRSFVQLWVGPEHYAGSIETLVIMLMIIQFILIRNDANIIDLTLNLRRKVLIGLLSASLAVIVAVILVGVFNLGIVGLCLGFMLGRLILSLGYPWMIGRVLGVPFRSQLKSVPRPASVTLLLFALALSASNAWLASTWANLVFAVGLTVVVVSFLAFYIGLSNDQRRHLLQRGRLVIRADTPG